MLECSRIKCEKLSLGGEPLQTLDEWGISNASIRYRWWYLGLPLPFLIDQIHGVSSRSIVTVLVLTMKLGSQFKTIGGAAFWLYASSTCRLHWILHRRKTWFVAGFIGGSIASLLSGAAFETSCSVLLKGELPAAVSSGFLGALGGFRRRSCSSSSQSPCRLPMFTL